MQLDVLALGIDRAIPSTFRIQVSFTAYAHLQIAHGINFAAFLVTLLLFGIIIIIIQVSRTGVAVLHLCCNLFLTFVRRVPLLFLILPLWLLLVQYCSSSETSGALGTHYVVLPSVLCVHCSLFSVQCSHNPVSIAGATRETNLIHVEQKMWFRYFHIVSTRATSVKINLKRSTTSTIAPAKSEEAIAYFTFKLKIANRRENWFETMPNTKLQHQMLN